MKLFLKLHIVATKPKCKTKYHYKKYVRQKTLDAKLKY